MIASPVYQRACDRSGRDVRARSAAVSGRSRRRDPHLDAARPVGPGDVAQPRSQRRSRGTAAGSPTPGSSTSTTSACRRRGHRAARAPRPAAPTASSQRPNTPPTSAAPGAAAQRPDARRRGCRSAAPGSSSLTGHRLTAHVVADVPGCDAQRSRSGAPPSGSAPAVVSTTWPGGRCRSSAAARPGRARRTRRRAPAPAATPIALGDQPVGGEAQRQRQRALLALRGVGARRHAVDRSARARRGAARPSTRRGARRRHGPRPAPRPARRAATAGRTPARPRVGRAGELLVGLGDQRARAGRRARRRAWPKRSPTSASLASHTSSVSADRRRRAGRPPASAACCAGAGCDRARGAARRTSTASATSVSSRKRRRSAGPSFTSARSSGENTVTRTTPSRSRGPAQALAVDQDPVAPGAVELGLDQRARARRRARTSARTTAASAPTRTSASVGAPRKLSSVAR